MPFGWRIWVGEGQEERGAKFGGMEAQGLVGAQSELSLLSLHPPVTLDPVLGPSPEHMCLLPQGMLARKETRAHPAGLEEWAPRERKVPSLPLRALHVRAGERLGGGREGTPHPCRCQEGSRPGGEAGRRGLSEQSSRAPACGLQWALGSVRGRLCAQEVHALRPSAASPGGRDPMSATRISAIVRVCKQPANPEGSRGTHTDVGGWAVLHGAHAPLMGANHRECGSSRPGTVGRPLGWRQAWGTRLDVQAACGPATGRCPVNGTANIGSGWPARL